jgi:hypothetical protein
MTSPPDDPLPPALESALRSALRPDERVLWVGRPCGRTYSPWHSARHMLLALLGEVRGFEELQDRSTGAESAMAMAILASILVAVMAGLHVHGTVGQWHLAAAAIVWLGIVVNWGFRMQTYRSLARQHQSTAYAVTDRRILKVSLFPRQATESCHPASVQRTDEGPGPRGTLACDGDAFLLLHDLADAPSIERLIRERLVERAPGFPV